MQSNVKREFDRLAISNRIFNQTPQENSTFLLHNFRPDTKTLIFSKDHNMLADLLFHINLGFFQSIDPTLCLNL